MRTVTCTEAIKTGRLSKAHQFQEAASAVRDLADDESDVGDAFVTLLVHAGIAAADAICCHELGEHARGESHAEATALIQRVQPDGNELARALDTLLRAKTRAGYGYEPVSRDARTRCWRAAEKLVSAAGDRLSA